MTLPFRRRSRPRGRARLAAVPGRDTQLLGQLRTGPADGTTWNLPDDSHSAVIFDFQGASDIGLMPEGVIAIKDWGRDTQPLAFRIRPESGPAS